MVVRNISSLHTPEEIDGVAAAISWSSYDQNPERLRVLAGSLAEGPDREVYGAFEANRLVGIVALDNATSSTVTVSRLGVDPSCRRQKIGTRLVEHDP